MIKSIFLMSKPQTYTSLTNGNFTRTDFAFFLVTTGILLAVSLIQRKTKLRESLAQQNTALRWAVYCAATLSVIFLGVLTSSDPSQFIYFQF
jgi:hypothetical protein